MLATIKKIIDDTAQQYGVPSWVAEDIAIQESSGDPTRVGDHGTSFGLFQLHWGGQGTGYSAQQLKDPVLNAQIGISHMSAAAKQAAVQGLSGFSALDYIAVHSGHPGYGQVGQFPTYESQLLKTYQSNGGKGGATASGNSTSSSGGSSSSNVKFSNSSDFINQIDQSMQIGSVGFGNLFQYSGAIALRGVLVFIGILFVAFGLFAAVQRVAK